MFFSPMANKTKLLLPLHVLVFYFLSFEASVSMNSLYSGQSLSGNKTISSENGRFELGFFKPGNSTNYYVGIWYKKLPDKTVVWVANRDNPLLDAFSSKLFLCENGSLVLYNQFETPVWSAETSANSVNSTILVLENSGNLVLKNNSNPSVILWQSFDFPTDTWLPGAKIGMNKLTGKREVYYSWKSSNDPSAGPFSLELDANGTSTYFILKDGKIHWTCGSWLERVSSFSTDEVAMTCINVSYESNETENFYIYSVANPSILVRYVLDVTGQVQQLIWQDDSRKWQKIWAKPKDVCEIYAHCGAYGACNQFSKLTCKCLDGFESKILGEWRSGNYTHGCRRKNPLQCNKGVEDGFLMVNNTRLPSYNVSLMNIKNSEACKSACLRDCSCTAYSFDGMCSIWQEDLLNIQYLSYKDFLGRDLHIRLSSAELEAFRGKTKLRFEWPIIKSAAAVVILIAILGLLVLITCRVRNFYDTKPTDDVLILFKFSDLKSATKNFSEKLGEGGFGSVFKGTLQNSTAIAVKSLKYQDQGEKQFRAELSTIGTVHHVNLVRLLGFCIKGKKKLLIYDYMPNGSLDSHLFYKNSKFLAWKKRYHIAMGIARGLAYLHDECRKCIIHCDIKPENILLDAEYNPMLSDFGLAKLLGRDFSRVLTTMKGTRGYIAPEMITGDPITARSDVFSYGMLLLEIISGRRNWETRTDLEDTYFPACAAICVSNGGDVLSLLDSKLQGNANVEEVIRACRVACWCIQDEEQTRPSMAHVVQIFEGVQEVNVPPIPRFLQTIINYTKNGFSI